MCDNSQHYEVILEAARRQSPLLMSQLLDYIDWFDSPASAYYFQAAAVNPEPLVYALRAWCLDASRLWEAVEIPRLESASDAAYMQALRDERDARDTWLVKAIRGLRQSLKYGVAFHLVSESLAGCGDIDTLRSRAINGDLRWDEAYAIRMRGVLYGILSRATRTLDTLTREGLSSGASSCGEDFSPCQDWNEMSAVVIDMLRYVHNLPPVRSADYVTTVCEAARPEVSC